jgi:uncharacterized integral membrane protein
MYYLLSSSTASPVFSSISGMAGGTRSQLEISGTPKGLTFSRKLKTLVWGSVCYTVKNAPKGGRMQFFLFLALLIAITLVLFAVQNAAVVTVSFLTFHLEGSLAFILVIVFASGFLAGILISLPSLLRKGAALREQKKKVKRLEDDIITSQQHRQVDKQPPV